MKPLNPIPKSECSGCGCFIPVTNLIRPSPKLRKQYCWHCSNRIRNELPIGKAHLKPPKRNTS